MLLSVVVVVLTDVRKVVINGSYIVSLQNFRAINRPLSKPSRRVYKGFAPICARLAQWFVLPLDKGLPLPLLPLEVYRQAV